VRAAVGARSGPDFVVVARTDAPDAPARAQAYEAAGADVIFAEAQTTLEDYRRVVDAVSIPVLANLTEFGITPLFTLDELRGAGVAIALYPLSASRAAARAAEGVYAAIRSQGTQRGVVERMQTRDELYEVLDYLRFERTLDELGS
jgi:methylisocitrate lyase